MFDLNEPIHIHVDKGRKTAKYWLSPMRLARNRGYQDHELNEIESILQARLQQLTDTWNEEKAKLI